MHHTTSLCIRVYTYRLGCECWVEVWEKQLMPWIPNAVGKRLLHTAQPGFPHQNSLGIWPQAQGSGRRNLVFLSRVSHPHSRCVGGVAGVCTKVRTFSSQCPLSPQQLQEMGTS